MMVFVLSRLHAFKSYYWRIATKFFLNSTYVYSCLEILSQTFRSSLNNDAGDVHNASKIVLAWKKMEKTDRAWFPPLGSMCFGKHGFSDRIFIIAASFCQRQLKCWHLNPIHRRLIVALLMLIYHALWLPTNSVWF